MGNKLNLDPNYIITRKKEITEELEALRDQRSKLPELTDQDKHEISSNFSSHMELSQQINELEIEFDSMNEE